MAFSSKQLNPGEVVALETRPHWKYLAPPVAAAAIVRDRGHRGVGAERSAGRRLPGVGGVVGGLVAAVIRYLRWRTTLLVVTNTRLDPPQRGLVQGRAGDPPRPSGRHQLSPDVVGPAPGSGRPGVGVGRAATARRCSRPCPDRPSIQNEIYRQIEECNARRPGYAVAPARPPLTASRPSRSRSTSSTICRRRGVLTEEEFAAKKAELLQRM